MLLLGERSLSPERRYERRSESPRRDSPHPPPARSPRRDSPGARSPPPPRSPRRDSPGARSPLPPRSPRRDSRDGSPRGDTPPRGGRSPRGRSPLRDSYRHEDDRAMPDYDRDQEDADAKNEGTNLFVTGLAKEVTEAQLSELFAKFGAVDKCQIMVDPHTRESRGFGFVNMFDVTGADAAIASLNNTSVSGRTLSIEKARRKRPRTPTPGRYFGPPKARRGGFRPRYDDRYPRRDYGRRYDDRPRYDDPYRRSRYDDRDRYYRGRGDRYPPPPPPPRYDERERYPPREYRDRYDRGYRDEPPRDDRYREERYPPSDGYREREDYRP